MRLYGGRSMLTKLRIQNFKQFDDVEIDLGPVTVLIGPNNSGKTTILQALMLWSASIWSYLDSINKNTSDAALNRLDLVSMKVPTVQTLWHNTRIVNGQEYSIVIDVEGTDLDPMRELVDWQQGFTLSFVNEESIACSPLPEGNITSQLNEIKVTQFLPPMSGLAATEDLLQRGAINRRIGEGQTAEVLRNICFRLFEDGKYWQKVVDYMHKLFGVDILPPQYVAVRGELRMSYKDQKGTTFDIASAGRGMLQMLLLLAYMYENPESILLLDEPDAHLEILRQREVYRLLVDVARELNSQVIIATHSEVIMNEAGENDVLIACVGKPHRIDEKGKSQVLKSLKEIGFDQYYQAIQRQWVLYLEGSTDLSVLQTFARTLNHNATQALERPFVHYIGNVVDHAANHFYGLREAQEVLKGITILDRPATSDQSKKAAKKQNTTGPLRVLYWQRNEIENYLCQPETLLAYARSLNQPEAESTMHEVIRGRIPPFALQDKDDIWWINTKMSDDFLVLLFKDFFNRLGQYNAMDKASFYILAYHVPAELIDPEVIEKLDAIWDIAKDAPNT
jgi:ABC-type Na+ transport system ATPase subunit NatA